MPLCKLCNQLIPLVEDQQLDAGRNKRTFVRTAAAVAGHVQQHHMDVLKGLIPVFVDFQYLVYGFLLEDSTADGAPRPAWLQGRDAVHANARTFLARESLCEVQRAAPANGAQKGIPQ